MLVLIPGAGVPPGGFPFVDKRTGRQFAGMSQDINGRAREVIQHRLSNPAIYPQSEPQHFSMEHVVREITDPICAKYPNYCMETRPVAPPAASLPTAAPQPVNPACPKCGGMDFDAQFCPTCSGHKLTGFKCKKCGTIRPR